jgi:hypothetical protein
MTIHQNIEKTLFDFKDTPKSPNDCAGHFYRYRDVAYIDKRGNWCAKQTMVKLKRLSCSGCADCGGLLELLEQCVYPDDIIFPDKLKAGATYILGIECYQSGYYDSSEESCYPSFIEYKKEGEKNAN